MAADHLTTRDVPLDPAVRAGRRGSNPSRIEPDDGCSKTSHHQADRIGFCPFKALFECQCYSL